jgi:hypothetical protein
MRYVLLLLAACGSTDRTMIPLDATQIAPELIVPERVYFNTVVYDGTPDDTGIDYDTLLRRDQIDVQLAHGSEVDCPAEIIASLCFRSDGNPVLVDVEGPYGQVSVTHPIATALPFELRGSFDWRPAKASEISVLVGSTLGVSVQLTDANGYGVGGWPGGLVATGVIGATRGPRMLAITAPVVGEGAIRGNADAAIVSLAVHVVGHGAIAQVDLDDDEGGGDVYDATHAISLGGNWGPSRTLYPHPLDAAGTWLHGALAIDVSGPEVTVAPDGDGLAITTAVTSHVDSYVRVAYGPLVQQIPVSIDPVK